MNQQLTLQTQLKKDITKIKRSLPKLRQDVETAETELADWQHRWGQLMAKLGLPQDASPTEANTLVDTHDRLFEKLREVTELTERVQLMRGFNAEFESRVQTVVKAFDWKADGSTPTQQVNKLHHVLSGMREDSRKLKDLNAEQEQQRRALAEVQQEHQLAKAELQELCLQAGVASSEELYQAEKASARRELLEQDQRESRERILQFAGESSFEDFLVEADAEDTDALNGQLEDIEQQRLKVDQDHTQQIQIAEREKTFLDSKTGGNQTALLADQHALLAEIRQQAERYVQLCLALDLLKAAAERYRKKHQGAVLKRAGELFQQLTGSAFHQLRNDADDEGNPRLVGLRTFGQTEETVAVDGMSDGTTDQLYLALRIASLEEWLTQHPPMPLIVDDLLINFDDDRALAALEVLAELSNKTQVIFFTHHQHLVELAKARLPSDVLFTQELTEAEPPAPPVKRKRTSRLFD